jgi:hypothetical protein
MPKSLSRQSRRQRRGRKRSPRLHQLRLEETDALVVYSKTTVISRKKTKEKPKLLSLTPRFARLRATLSQERASARPGSRKSTLKVTVARQYVERFFSHYASFSSLSNTIFFWKLGTVANAHKCEYILTHMNSHACTSYPYSLCLYFFFIKHDFWVSHISTYICYGFNRNVQTSLHWR